MFDKYTYRFICEADKLRCMIEKYSASDFKGAVVSNRTASISKIGENTEIKFWPDFDPFFVDITIIIRTQYLLDALPESGTIELCYNDENEHICIRFEDKQAVIITEKEVE